MEMDVMEELRQSVINYDEEAAAKAAKKVLEMKMDPYEAITESLAPAIREMGDRFGKGRLFSPN